VEGSGIAPGEGVCEHRTSRRGGEGEGQRRASPPPPSFWVVTAVREMAADERVVDSLPICSIFVGFS
jgi:hypothetical protein